MVEWARCINYSLPTPTGRLACFFFGQCVKEKLITQKEIFKTDEMVFELLKPLLDYNKLANIWGDAFGFDAVQIGIYNKSSLISGDVVSDFFTGLVRIAPSCRPHLGNL